MLQKITTSWQRQFLRSYLQLRAARFFLTQHTKTEKIYQIATKLPNVRHIFQMTIEYTKLFPLQCPAKFTQIWIFGLKLKHLATLLGTNPISMM
jgi:hypothetical protein